MANKRTGIKPARRRIPTPYAVYLCHKARNPKPIPKREITARRGVIGVALEKARDG